MQFQSFSAEGICHFRIVVHSLLRLISNGRVTGFNTHCLCFCLKKSCHWDQSCRLGQSIAWNVKPVTKKRADQVAIASLIHIMAIVQLTSIFRCTCIRHHKNMYTDIFLFFILQGIHNICAVGSTNNDHLHTLREVEEVSWTSRDLKPTSFLGLALLPSMYSSVWKLEL